MSIMIDKAKCKGCGMCTSVCPGSLIYQDSEKKAFIKYPKDCWGCASCIKECHFGAIALYLGADIGGMGSLMTVKRHTGHADLGYQKARRKQGRDSYQQEGIQ